MRCLIICTWRAVCLRRYQEGNEGEDGSGTAGRNGRKKRRKDEGHEEIWLGTDEIDEILARTYHANKRDKTGAQKRRWGSKSKTPSGTYTAGRLRNRSHGARPAKRKKKREQYLLIDGYNIIFAWEELRELAERNIDSARGKPLDILCNYQGAKKCQVIAVFDAYRVQGIRRSSWTITIFMWSIRRKPRLRTSILKNLPMIMHQNTM